jgi:hypothetical protein
MNIPGMRHHILQEQYPETILNLQLAISDCVWHYVTERSVPLSDPIQITFTVFSFNTQPVLQIPPRSVPRLKTFAVQHTRPISRTYLVDILNSWMLSQLTYLHISSFLATNLPLWCLHINNNHPGRYDHLLQCDIVLLGLQFSAFQRILVRSSSLSNSARSLLII